MVSRERSAFEVRTIRHPTMFLALRCDVVVVVAERFPIRSIPEQRLIATMRRDVVHDQPDAARICLRRSVHPNRAGIEQPTCPALHTELVGLLGKEDGPSLLPFPCVAALTGRSALPTNRHGEQPTTLIVP